MLRFSSIILALFTSIALASTDSPMVIDQILAKDNYVVENWEPRGLNPSSPSIIALMEAATKDFLIKLKAIASDRNLSKAQLEEEVMLLVDALPWYELDTEEREFLADVISPAIESVGLNPRVFF